MVDPDVVVPVDFPVAEADDEVDVADKSWTPTEGAICTKCEPVSLVQMLVPNGPHHQFWGPMMSQNLHKDKDKLWRRQVSNLSPLLRVEMIHIGALT